MSNLPWLRLYSSVVDDEKIRLLAFEDRWHFIAILCLKQQGVLDKKDHLLERKISVKLGVQLRELDEIKRRLMEVDLIGDDFTPTGWDKRQFSSDSSADRTRKYRENNKKKTCDGNETSHERHCDPVDTDTEKEKEKKQKKKTFLLPQEINPELWDRFERHRKHIKKPMSDDAKVLQSNVLKKYNHSQQSTIVDYSVTGGYPRLYENQAENSKPNYSNDGSI